VVEGAGAMTLVETSALEMAAIRSNLSRRAISNGCRPPFSARPRHSCVCARIVSGLIWWNCWTENF